MRFLAIPQRTAEWFYSNGQILTVFAALVDELANTPGLTRSVLAAGPLRITATTDNSILAVWNVEYIDATGNEKWGFLKLASPFGIIGQHDCNPSLVIERCVNVVNNRLQ